MSNFILKYHNPYLYACTKFPSIDYCREDYITVKKFLVLWVLENSAPRDGTAELTF
jgi:hypothetical protein